MTEGDCWVSIVGTIHIEKEERPKQGYRPTVYWCGMQAPHSHTRIGKPTVFYDPAKDSDRRACERCERNRSKAKSEPRPTAKEEEA